MLTSSVRFADTLTTYYFKNRAQRRQYLKDISIASLAFVEANIAFDLDLLDESADLAHSHALKLLRK